MAAPPPEAPPPPSRRLAVFGGSFDPPHVGHVLAVVYVLTVAPVDDVLVVPCFEHPLEKALSPFEHRLAMTELAVGWLPGVSVSRIEQELGGPSRTLRTLEAIARREPGAALRLVLGSDVLAELPKWHAFDRVAALASPLILDRAGHARGGAPVLLPDVSSTHVRDALAAGRREDVVPLVPHRVLEYVDAHGLYRP